MKMKLWFLTVALVFLAACVATNTKKAQRYKRIEYSLISPIILSPTHVDTTPTRYRIIDFGDCVLYELQHNESFADNEMVIVGGAPELKQVSYRDSVYYDLFIWQKNAIYGYMLKTLTDSFNVKIRADSIIGVRTFKEFDLGSMIRSMNITFERRDETSKSGFVKLYTVKDTAYDSLFYYFDNRYRNIAYSLSPTLDSAYSSKLYKFEGYYKKGTSASFSYANKYRKVTFELKELPINNEKQLDTFFTRFKKHISK